MSLEQTPLAPATALTNALADGLGVLSDGIGDLADQDPTGLAQLLSQTVGQEQPGYSNEQDGLAGVVSNVSQGLAAGSQGGPLDPIVDPLAQTLGYSEDEGVDGVAQGLTYVGDVLASDQSPLSPITSDLLAPIVGTSDSDQDSEGVSGTLLEIGEGLTDLTNEDSALAPLDPVTSAVSEQALSSISDGVSQVGQIIVDGAEMAGPLTPLVETVGNLLGGDRQPNADMETMAASSPISSSPTGPNAPDPLNLVDN
ncbi:hypothetical protein LMED105_09740 [Limnobacter sp. MED105]|nr:hypothetical protein LMED105_09740 [Limnobacter sp. MED105]